MDDKKEEKLRQIAEEVVKEYGIFWAKGVKKYNMALTAVMKYTPFGVFPFIDVFEATDDQKKKANEILKDIRIEKKSKQSGKKLEGLGKI